MTNFRVQIRRLLKDSPSLRPYLAEILDDCYRDSRKIMAQRSGLNIETRPEHTIANLDQILDEDWLP